MEQGIKKVGRNLCVYALLSLMLSGCSLVFTVSEAKSPGVTGFFTRKWGPARKVL